MATSLHSADAVPLARATSPIVVLSRNVLVSSNTLNAVRNSVLCLAVFGLVDFRTQNRYYGWGGLWLCYYATQLFDNMALLLMLTLSLLLKWRVYFSFFVGRNQFNWRSFRAYEHQLPRSAILGSNSPPIVESQQNRKYCLVILIDKLGIIVRFNTLTLPLVRLLIGRINSLPACVSWPLSCLRHSCGCQGCYMFVRWLYHEDGKRLREPTIHAVILRLPLLMRTIARLQRVRRSNAAQRKGHLERDGRVNQWQLGGRICAW